jgi:DNA repair exonuclease SbcCD ATPase subunit
MGAWFSPQREPWKECDMFDRTAIAIAMIAAALMMPACNRSEPARDPAAATRESNAAAELQRKRDDETGPMERRVVDLERRWTEMEAKVREKSATPTAALRAEVKEDVNNIRQAVADLKTTTPENWWDRHERAMERTVDDIEADVRRFAKTQSAPLAVREPETPVQAAPFESRRDRFVTRLQARVDAMEGQLENVRAQRALQTELEDTRARLRKLKEDVDRLKNASAGEWWEISSKRVSEYIDRVEDSIRRLDDNKK